MLGDRLPLTFDAPLNGGSNPVASAFAVKANGSPVSLADANAMYVSGRQVTLASAVAAGDDVVVSYERPSRSWLRNVHCECAPSFSDEPVRNFTGMSPATAAIISDAGDDDIYSLGATIRVTLTFSEAVTVNGAPRLKIKMDPDWGGFWADYERWANYETGTGTTTLTFAYRVVAKRDYAPLGIAALENRLDLNGGQIRSKATQTNAHLWYGGLGRNAGHRVD